VIDAIPKRSVARAIAFTRDFRFCRHCGGPINLSAHHIHPRSLGGDNDPRNLVTLCDHCHKTVCEWCSRKYSYRIPWQLPNKAKPGFYQEWCV